ncbi:MAG: LytTR family transcriptional regulator DNA-binding domain-containing protein [Chitinophagales bacterium]|nr:LytTR family transcriptional regulator DNA-binding domain-containing protein [Chitinophagales bacterium]
MEPFKIQIVEDELLVAHDIAARLKQAGYMITGITDNIDSAIKMFKKEPPDLVLLDISIKGNKTGVDIAYAINELQPTPFIYITAHADAATVNRAKNTFPAAYVVKPFTTSSLLVSIELALHNFAYRNENDNKEEQPAATEGNIYLKQNHVFIKDGHKFIKQFLNDILFLSAEDNYVKIVTTEKTYLIRNTLTKTMDVLNRDYFVRVHRSYCVNVNHIDTFTENELVVQGNTIPVGRNYKDELMKVFKFR